jgi:hypothetical protein
MHLTIDEFFVAIGAAAGPFWRVRVMSELSGRMSAVPGRERLNPSCAPPSPLAPPLDQKRCLIYASGNMKRILLYTKYHSRESLVEIRYFPLLSDVASDARQLDS